MIIVVGSEHGNKRSNPGHKAICILYRANTFGKGVYSSILPCAMGECSRRQTEFKAVELYLKTDLVSHPVHGVG